jgi:hypothetical protein
MPIHPPKMAFSNDDLVELEWVFASVCEALEANQEGRTRKRRHAFAGDCSCLLATTG